MFGGWKSLDRGVGGPGASISGVLFVASVVVFLLSTLLLGVNAYDRKYHPEMPWREGEFERFMAQAETVAAISLAIAICSFLYRLVRR